MPATAKKLVDTGDGHAWWSLGKQKCSDEGKAMGHCGNKGSPMDGDNILSLRKEHTIGGAKYYEPKLTFIQNGDFIGEMKGRGNNKPAPHYHPHISKLLGETGLIPVGGGYKPENNFDVRDLDEATFNDLVAKRPALGVLRGESKSIHHQAFDQVGDIPQHLAEHLAESPGIHVGLQKRLSYSDDTVRGALAANPNVHPDLHAQLVGDNEQYVRKHMAGNPNLRQDLHAKLVRDDDDEVREALAGNPNLRQSLHTRLAGDSVDSVRSAMAGNPNLHQSLHAKLAGDSEDEVRELLAGNPNLNLSLHEKLANDDNDHVRRALAENPNLHPDLHNELATDHHSYVRRALAGNPNFNDAYHELLVDDREGSVREAMAGNPNLHGAYHEQMSQDRNEFVRGSLAGNPNLLTSLHDGLAGDQSHFVRRHMAGNPNLRQDLHAKLAADRYAVRNSVAGNKNISPEAQMILLNDPRTDQHTLGKLQTNPNLTKQARKILDAKIEQIMGEEGDDE
jgi:hypothetical protein